MSIECEDQIELYKYDLQEISLASLKGLLSVVRGCTDCEGCESQVSQLERLIAEKTES